MRWPHRSNDRFLLVGLTQSGKTTWAKALVDEFGPWRVDEEAAPTQLVLVVLDPKADDQLFAWFGPGSRFPDLSRRVAHWVPQPGDEHGLDEGFRAVFLRGNCLVWIDELSMVATANRWPAWMRALYAQGARRHIGVVGLTQDPVGIPVWTRSQSEHKIVFRLQHPDYVAMLSRACDADMSAAASLGPHEWLLASYRLPRDVQPVRGRPVEVG